MFSTDGTVFDDGNAELDVIYQLDHCLALSLGPDTHLNAHGDLIIQWTVHNGVHGLYLGRDGSDPDNNTLLLAPGNRYKITRITAPDDPDDPDDPEIVQVEVCRCATRRHISRHRHPGRLPLRWWPDR